jgi:hypothetical protein
MKLTIFFALLAITGCVLATKPAEQDIRDILDSPTMDYDEKTDALDHLFTSKDDDSETDIEYDWDGVENDLIVTNEDFIGAPMGIWKLIKIIKGLTAGKFECFIRLVLVKPELNVIDFFTGKYTAMCKEPQVAKAILDERFKATGKVLAWRIGGCDSYKFFKYWAFKAARTVIAFFLDKKPTNLVNYFGSENYERMNAEIKGMFDECLKKMKN